MKNITCAKTTSTHVKKKTWKYFKLSYLRSIFIYLKKQLIARKCIKIYLTIVHHILNKCISLFESNTLSNKLQMLFYIIITLLKIIYLTLSDQGVVIALFIFTD